MKDIDQLVNKFNPLNAAVTKKWWAFLIEFKLCGQVAFELYFAIYKQCEENVPICNKSLLGEVERSMRTPARVQLLWLWT